MNRFRNDFLAVLLMFFHPLASGISAAQEPTTNTAVVEQVQFTPSVSVVTFKLTANNSAQPTLVQVGATNDINSVVSSLTFHPETPVASVHIKSIPGSLGKAHTLELMLPRNDEYIVSLVDRSFVASPRYRVATTRDTEGRMTTRIYAGLSIKNGSPNPLQKATVKVQLGSINVELKDIEVASGAEHIEFEVGVSEKATLPIAYWANASDFKKEKAEAELQFPMKGNWPPSFTLPGPIHFEFESKPSLPIFELTGSPVEQLAKFKTEVERESHKFDDIFRVEVTSATTYKSLETTQWPLLRYEEIITYSTLDTKKASTFVRTEKVPLVKMDGFDLRSANTQLFVFPGDENSEHLGALLEILQAVLKSLPEDDDLKAITKGLAQILPVLKTLEARRDVLLHDHAALVNQGASADEIAKSRTQLNHTKVAVSSLLESYNAWVKAYPQTFSSQDFDE